MKHTLKTSEEYRTAYRGKRLRGKYFTLIVTDSEDYRYGVVVKKSVGNSIERNRIKRVARDVLLTKTTGGTLLALVRDSAGGVRNGLLREDLMELVEKGGGDSGPR